MIKHFTYTIVCVIGCILRYPVFDENLLELPGMRPVFGVLAVFSLLNAAFTLGQAFFLAQALANIWSGEQVAAQMQLLACFFICLVLRRVLAFARSELLERLALRCCLGLETDVLAATFSPDASLARTIGTASTAQTATDGLDEVQRYIRVIPPQICDMAIVTSILVIALFVFDWVSAVITLAAVPITVMFMIILGRQARARAMMQYEASSRLSNHFIDTLRGIGELIAFGAVDQSARSVFETSERLRVETVKTLSVATLSGALLDLVNVFAVAACSMMLAFRLLDATIALPTALCALMLAPEALAPLRSFASEFHASLDGKNSLASVLAIAERNQSSVGQDDDASEALFSEELETWDESSCLKISNACFRYKGASVNALDNVTLSLKGYEHVAIVGSSGSGKTTLADIVAGFRKPDSGVAELGGCVINGLNLEAWKRHIAYIPQNPYLFRATLRENIVFYEPDATEERILQAVHDAGLEQLVNELPMGIDTVLGDGGRGLSGGQAQRIALARAFLANRKVLIFDEPTAHLDIETELELKQSMLDAMDQKLVVFATHRLHWLKDMDRIIVLEDGRIADDGSFGELACKDGALARFMDAESGGDAS